MAYSKRGSRSIQVDQLTYRWRAQIDGTVAVWHVLDAGLLRVLPPPQQAHGFDPMPAYVARAIREARHRGWRTADHFELVVDHALFAELNAFGPQSRARHADPIAHQLEVLGLGPVQGELALRVVLCPAGSSTVVFDAAQELTVYAFQERMAALVVPCDPDWLRDVLVDVRETDPSASRGPAAAVSWIDPTGTSSWRGSVQDPRALAAAAGLWRLAMSNLDLAGRRAIEWLHPVLELEEPPWEIDRSHRVIRLFGELRPTDELAFLAVLGGSGWVVDARDLIAIDPSIRTQLARRRDLADVWVDTERRLERAFARTVQQARDQARVAVRQAMARRLAPKLDPRWRDRALQVLGRGGRLEGLERWLGPELRAAEAPVEAAWFKERVRFVPPERPPWLALREGRVFVGLPDGSVLAT